MLRNFLYLNTQALSQYIAALEGGLTTEATTRLVKRGGGKGGVNVKLADASMERGHENEETRKYADTQEAQFDRLLKAADQDAEALAWVEVTQPDLDFKNIGVGAMVSWECEVYVPEFVRMMSASGEMVGAIDMMRTLLPAAKSLGLQTEEPLPSEDTLEATSNFLKGVNVKVLVVGDDETSEWKVAGQINDQYLHGELDGPARVVGKVTKVMSAGTWKPFMSFPGMGAGSREQRRKMERQAPEAGKEDQYLHGPALMLDILAIYR
ncbi:DUF6414 family protein [Pseudarthrobacter sp. alpha12b]